MSSNLLKPFLWLKHSHKARNRLGNKLVQVCTSMLVSSELSPQFRCIVLCIDQTHQISINLMVYDIIWHLYSITLYCILCSTHVYLRAVLPLPVLPHICEDKQKLKHYHKKQYDFIYFPALHGLHAIEQLPIYWNMFELDWNGWFHLKNNLSIGFQPVPTQQVVTSCCESSVTCSIERNCFSSL